MVCSWSFVAVSDLEQAGPRAAQQPGSARLAT